MNDLIIQISDKVKNKSARTWVALAVYSIKKRKVLEMMINCCDNEIPEYE